MNTPIPSAEEIRVLLLPFDTARLRSLAALSGVPFTTLWKIRSADTENPGIETVRKFMPHIEAATSAATAEQVSTDAGA